MVGVVESAHHLVRYTPGNMAAIQMCSIIGFYLLSSELSCLVILKCVSFRYGKQSKVFETQRVRIKNIIFSFYKFIEVQKFLLSRILKSLYTSYKNHISVLLPHVQIIFCLLRIVLCLG